MPIGNKTAAFAHDTAIALSGLGRRVRRLEAMPVQPMSVLVNVKSVGAYGDGIHDDTQAIQRAIDELISLGSGGVGYFPVGIYLITSQIVIDGSAIVLAGQTIGGGSGTDGRIGTTILVGADIAGDVFVFGSASTNYTSCSVRDMSFADVGAAGAGNTLRNYAVSGAALHVRRCDRFILSNVTFRGIRGTALKVSKCTFGHFSNAIVQYCGAAAQPAVDITSLSSVLYTQGSVFVDFNVEVTCGGAQSVSIDQYAGANKFFGFGFETAALTSSQGVETCNGIFLQVAGGRNSFVGFHFNIQDQGGTNPKVSITGDRNTFSDWIFDGLRPASNIYLDGAQHNAFSNIVDDGATGNEALWMFEFAGSSLQNTLTNVFGNRTSGISVNSASHYNKIQASFTVGSGAAYECAGTYNDADIKIVSFTGAGTLITISGNHNDTLVHTADNDACATEVVLVSGSVSNIVEGSKINDSLLAHGIRVTGNSGRFNGIGISNVGKHGIFINGSQPLSICNNIVYNSGRATVSTYNGISLESTTNKTIGGVCNGNRVYNDLGTLLYGIFVTDNAGSPRYDYWTFVANNVRSGGAISISVGNNIIEHNRT